MASEALDALHEIEALVGGYHGDAFRILGPHRLVDDKAGAERWVVRAFLPQAASAELVTSAGVFPMEKRHAHGLFVAEMPSEPDSYRYRLALWNGSTEEIDDPYRFPPLLSDFDIHLHGEGTNFESYNSLGSHLAESLGVKGVRFSVWAPNAEVVCLVGDFNHWDTRRHPMRLRNGGIWEIFIPGAAAGTAYKYYVRSKFQGYRQLK